MCAKEGQKSEKDARQGKGIESALTPKYHLTA